MARRCCGWLFLSGLVLLTSCQRAQRFPPPEPSAEKTERKEEDPDKYLYRFSWVEPGETRALPILFVPDTNPEWQDLKGYWNALPFPAGMPTAHLGLAPVQALAAIALTEHHAAIKIRVPLGLPDPTENFPKSNPPTLGKWRLGRALFHEPLLQADQGPYACATCHKPEFGFTEHKSLSSGGKYNTLCLINVAYNRRQFWDGRVETLEETLVRGLADERVNDPQRSDKALQHHNWGGFVRALAGVKGYDREFQRVFGLRVDEHPTQDGVAQALATYMRTILSGDSLYDRADKVRKDKGAKELTEEHFLSLLGKKDKNGKSLAVLHDEPGRELTNVELKAIAGGYELFNGKARCAQCHTPPLFTDRDYHNVGYLGEEAEPAIGTETGRAVHVSVGLKEARLIGAFRTPSLRNLARTGPYFHNGAHYTLDQVVEFYDKNVLPISHLAKVLKDGDGPQRLQLTKEEKDTLVMFLRALEGTPVDPIVMNVEK